MGKVKIVRTRTIQGMEVKLGSMVGSIDEVLSLKDDGVNWTAVVRVK